MITYDVAPKFTKDSKLKREALTKLKLHLAMAHFHTSLCALARTEVTGSSSWQLLLEAELV